MEPFRFRPAVVSLEDRLTPAADYAGAAHAISVFNDLKPAMDWLWAHENTLTVFHDRANLAIAMPNIVHAAITSIELAAETRTDLQFQQATNPATASALAPYVDQMTAGITQVYTIGLAALKMGHDFGTPDSAFVPPAPPSPPPPPTSTPDASDAGMTDTIPDVTASDFVAKADGLKSRDVTVGTGTPVGANDTITVQYTGWLVSNGNVFDSSRPSLSPRGSSATPLTSPLSGLIKGWQEGIPGMMPGGIRQLVIPAALAYGAAGSGSSVPPNSDLVFEIKMISSTPTNTTNQG